MICQVCGFDPWSGHIHESTNKCITKWNNKLIAFLSLSNQLKKNFNFLKRLGKMDHNPAQGLGNKPGRNTLAEK